MISRSNSAAGAGLAKASELGFIVVEKAAAERKERVVRAIEALLVILAVLRRRERWPTMFLEQVRRKVRLSGEDITVQGPRRCFVSVRERLTKRAMRECTRRQGNVQADEVFTRADDLIARQLP